ncbi:hypothetical protein AS850_16200 [Frondihabitans sp. 762G35]|nr:hypothetical protein AS850_16200 [Frondihabitans sp. 762G35]
MLGVCRDLPAPANGMWSVRSSQVAADVIELSSGTVGCASTGFHRPSTVLQVQFQACAIPIGQTGRVQKSSLGRHSGQYGVTGPSLHQHLESPRLFSSSKTQNDRSGSGLRGRRLTSWRKMRRVSEGISPINERRLHRVGGGAVKDSQARSTRRCTSRGRWTPKSRRSRSAGRKIRGAHRWGGTVKIDCERWLTRTRRAFQGDSFALTQGAGSSPIAPRLGSCRLAPRTVPRAVPRNSGGARRWHDDACSCPKSATPERRS